MAARTSKTRANPGRFPAEIGFAGAFNPLNLESPGRSRDHMGGTRTIQVTNSGVQLCEAVSSVSAAGRTLEWETGMGKRRERPYAA